MGPYPLAPVLLLLLLFFSSSSFRRAIETRPTAAVCWMCLDFHHRTAAQLLRRRHLISNKISCAIFESESCEQAQHSSPNGLHTQEGRSKDVKLNQLNQIATKQNKKKRGKTSPTKEKIINKM